MASKDQKHKNKMAKKRAEKAARNAKYKALAGTSKKAKRQNRKAGPTPQKGNHAMSDCGNVGCRRCYPNL